MPRLEPVELRKVLQRDKTRLNWKRAQRALKTRKGPNWERLLVEEKREPGTIDRLKEILGIV